MYTYVPGSLEFTFPLDQIGPVPEAAVLLTESPGGVHLYRLDTGELQVNFRHGREEYVFTFDGCPATATTTRVYDVSTWELLSEFTRQP